MINFSKTNKSRKQFRSRKKTAFQFEKLEPKRYLTSVGWDGAGQGSAELTYYLGDAPAQIGQETFENTIREALDVWAEVVDVTFTETSTPGLNDSLDITFASLDGSGGTLAQAFFPDDINPARVAGDIQFDLAESWEVGNAQGSRASDLLFVAVHEIGHSLGLGHSHDANSVLSSTVSPNQQFTGLAAGDRAAALALYAPAESITPTVTPPSTTPLTPTTTPEVDQPTADPHGHEDEDAPEHGHDEEETTEPDLNDNNDQDEKRNRFRRLLQNRFRRISSFINRFYQRFTPSTTQVDSPTVETQTGDTDSFRPRVVFQVKFFRFFR